MKNDIARHPDVLWQTGANLIIFPFIVFGLGVALFMAGGSLGTLKSNFVLLFGASTTLLVTHLTFRQNLPFVLGLTLALGLLAILVSLLFHDTSIDGQHYHFQAIYALANGWNPYWDVAAPPAIADPASRWVTHYPMSAWIFDATLLSAGLPLEATKAINFLAAFSSGLIAAAALLRLGLSLPLAGVFAVAAVGNPIVCSQLFTRMNDGLLASCLLIFTLSAAVWLMAEDRRGFWTAAAAMLLGLNLKFSAIPIFFVLCASVALAWLVLKGRGRAMRASLQLLAIGTVGLAVLGFAPYVLNAVNFGHPFYPLMGSSSVDIMKGNTPEILEGLSSVGRLLFSLFSETHGGYGDPPQLRLPIWFSLHEIRSAGGVDVRIGGFGPLFSAALMLAIATAIVLVMRSRDSARVRWLLFAALALLVSVLVIPQNWWARYVPQLWLVPLGVALAAVTVKMRVPRTLGFSLLIVMLLDAGIVVSSSSWLTARRSAAVSNQMDSLKREGKSYCLTPDLAQSRLFLFQAGGIDAKPQRAPGERTCDTPLDIAAYGPDRFGGRICECAAERVRQALPDTR